MYAMKRVDLILQPLPLVLLAFGVLCCSAAFASEPITLSVEGLSPLAVWLDGLFVGGWSVAVSLLLVIFSAVVTSRLIMRYSLSVVRSMLPLVLYGIWVLGVGFTASVSLHLTSLLIIGSIERLIMSFKREERFGEVMSSAVYASLAVMLVPDAVWAMVLLPVQWLSFRRSVREVAAALLSAVAVVAVVSFAWWVPSGEALAFLRLWSEALTPPLFDSFDVVAFAERVGLVAAVLLGMLVVLTAVSSLLCIARHSTMRLRARKVHYHFFLLFIVGLLLLLCGSPLAVVLMALSSVTLLHTFFVYCPGLHTVVLYILLLLLALL